MIIYGAVVFRVILRFVVMSCMRGIPDASEIESTDFSSLCGSMSFYVAPLLCCFLFLVVRDSS